MADIVLQHNVEGLGTLKRLSDHSTATAGGAGQATTVTGLTIDRKGFSTGSLPRSADLGVLYEATLQSGATLSLGYDVQHAPDGATWTDFQTATYVTVATGPSGGGVVKGDFNVAVDLGMAQRYVRFNYNPSLSSTGTDTLIADACGFFAGFDRLAAPAQG
jgi:hypothetical protein